jgi:hypothetical protein
MPVLQAEVTQAGEVASTAETAYVTAVLDAETSAQEAATAWDRAVIHVKDAEDWAALVEREARERVSRVEAENAIMLASTHKDAECLVRKITLIEGELVEVRWAPEVAEENSRGLFDAAVDAEHRWEVS